jgi:hypothetical protein
MTPSASFESARTRAIARAGRLEMTAVTEIAPDVYRISAYAPDYGIQFNQFLVRDDEPFPGACRHCRRPEA